MTSPISEKHAFMTSSPYDLMQSAVDIVGTSPHPTNKIAATLAGDGFHLSRTNCWPSAIEQAFGRETRIGGSSGTIHAETACVIAASAPTKGAALFVTDPPCPNCVKNIAEAGVKTLYIDHKGFDKDFALRRGHHFEHMAMKICERAGISVYVVHRKEKKLVSILEIPADFKPVQEKPIRIETVESADENAFAQKISETKNFYGDEPFALCFARGASGVSMISAQPHPTLGFTSATMEEPEGKYSFIMEPVNRLIMAAARYGLKIDPAFLYSSRVPTAREQINMLGANLNALYVDDLASSRDENGLQAMNALQAGNVIEFKSL